MRKRRKAKLPLKIRRFISRKIKKNMEEGKTQEQSTAIAYSQARKMYPRYKTKLKRK